MSNNIEIGNIYEGYKIIKFLGQGQYSLVFYAENSISHEHCALKILKEYSSMSEVEKNKCLQEVNLLKSLNHPGIIKYLDSFIKNDQLFIAIEWADKGDLKRLLKRYEQENERLDEGKIILFLQILASALVHMHSKRVLHRDLKPANILYFSDGVKVGDLGLGRCMSDSTCVAYSRVGTPLYMAPEVISNKGYSFESDIWSLGCVLYEMVTLKSPFKTTVTTNLMDLFNNINKAEYRHLDESSASNVICYLVEKMLQPKPENRITLLEILSICETYLNENKPVKSSVDIYTISEDILEKLKIINFENNFCKKMGYERLIHKYFFIEDYKPIKANKTNKTNKINGENEKKNEIIQKFYIYYELVIWILVMIKGNLPIEKGGNMKFELIKYKAKTEKEEKYYISKLISEVRNANIDIPNENELWKGYGETCILVLTQILDKYLIQRNYIFENPVHRMRSVNECTNKKVDFSVISLEIISKDMSCQRKNQMFDDAERRIYSQTKFNSQWSIMKDFDFYSKSIKKLLTEYIIDENEKIEDIQKKERRIVGNDSKVLLKYGKVAPKISSLNNKIKEVNENIVKLNKEKEEISTKIEKNLTRFNLILEERTNKRNLKGCIDNIKNEVLKITLKSQLINSRLNDFLRKMVDENKTGLDEIYLLTAIKNPNQKNKSKEDQKLSIFDEVI